MKWRVGNILVGFSSLICIALCVLWARSYWRSDGVSWRKVTGEEPVRARTVMIYSGKGGIEAALVRERTYYSPEMPVPRGWRYESAGSPATPGETPIELGWRKAAYGFGMEHDWSTPNGFFNLAGLPGVGQMFISAPVGWTESSRGVWVPHWFLVLVFAVLPVKRTYLWTRSSRRKKRGLCAECGYDLRGGGERCPECGAIVSNPTGGTSILRET